MEEAIPHASCKRPRIDGGDDQRGLLMPWNPPASRIFRVSRVTGGKDRHSKVLTARGLRDRRVRLSVSTAIQFYDLQDRLGFDQPSKAVEWLIKAAAAPISCLPSLCAPFPHPEAVHVSPAKSRAKLACESSASETSKGSVLSPSRSEIRGEDDGGGGIVRHGSLNPSGISHSSFSELLAGGCRDAAPSANCCFGGLGFASQQMQPFSLLQEDHLIAGDCGLNFSIAQGLNRGTLQSNSPSHLPQCGHRHHVMPTVSNGFEVPSLPFLSGHAISAATGAFVQYQLPGGLDGRLQFCQGGHFSDLKGKWKD